GDGRQEAFALPVHVRRRAGERLGRLLARPAGARAGRLPDVDGTALLRGGRDRGADGRRCHRDARRATEVVTAVPGTVSPATYRDTIRLAVASFSSTGAGWRCRR